MKRTHTKLNTAEGQTKRFGVGMLSPTVVILLIMTAYPLIFTFFYSFTNYNLLRNLRSPAKITVFQNYVKLLKDPYFQQSIWNTVKFTIFAVIFEMLIGFAMALFVNSLHKGQKTMRTLLLLPYLLPTVTVALSWRMMLSPNYGIVNQVLQALHLPVFNWFSDIRTAFGMLVLIDVWQSAPFVFLLLYAALQSVPQGQYEAARIDGASSGRIFRRITVPLLAPTLGLTMIVNVISASKVFSELFPLFNGNPGSAYSLYTVVYYLFDMFYKQWQLGPAAASAVVLFVIVLIFTMLQLFIQRKWKNY